MDLEHLTKHQIVLLTLLVSFMTSIATGIVTVSLMDQAPPEITKTIDQVVERTVQTVMPAQNPAATATAATVKTVVIKSDDLATESIASAQKAVIRIVGKGDDKMIARGVIIDNKGLALTDKGALASSDFTSFEAILSDGERVPVTEPKGQSASSSIELLTIEVGTSTGFAPAPIADAGKLRLGQSVIRISGTGGDVVGEGIIASLPTKDSNEVQSSVTSATPGSVLVSLYGEIIGLITGDSLADGTGFYTLAAVPQISAPPATKQTSGS